MHAEMYINVSEFILVLKQLAQQLAAYERPGMAIVEKRKRRDQICDGLMRDLRHVDLYQGKKKVF
jgi:hypothetical protein